MICIYLKFPGVNDGWGPTGDQLTPILRAMKDAGRKAAKKQKINIKIEACDEPEE